MPNLRIIHKNLFDSYNALAMVTGAAAANYPLTNLTDDTKAKTWRSTNLTSPRFSATWASNQTLSGVALAFTNLIQGSTFRVYLYNATSGGTLLYDSTALSVSYDYDAPLGFSSIGSSSFAYGGGAHVSAFFTAVSGVRRMEIEFTSASNPDGYVEVSRIIAGAYWEPTYNAGYGASTGFEDSTIGVRTSSGNLITDRGTITRSIDFSLGYMDSADKSALNNLFRSVGKSQPLFFSLIPSAGAITEEQLSYQIYGKLDQDISIALPFLQRYESSVRIVEI